MSNKSCKITLGKMMKKEQFKDFGYNLEDVNGYIFKSNSDPVKRFQEDTKVEINSKTIFIMLLVA